MAILNNIKYLLLEKGCTQNDLCEAIKISKSALSNIISYKQNATLETAFDMAKYFNKPIEDIFYIDKNNTSKEAIKQFNEMIGVMNQLELLIEEEDILKRTFINIIDGYILKYSKGVVSYLLNDYFLNGETQIENINPIALNMLTNMSK